LKNGKGFVKEYAIYGNYINKLIFEGEYLNGKRNGKGKEFNYNVIIIFDGIYLCDKRWNGIGYDNSNNIIYELENGKGFIKEYNFNDILIFEGEYSNGERNGKGKEYYHDSLIFEGEYLNGKRNGKGKEFYYNGKVNFEGEYSNGKRNGTGKEYYYDGQLIFEGEYAYNYRKKGKEYFKGKLEFEGEYLFNNKWNGKGFDVNGKIIYELNNGNGKIKIFDYGDGLVFEGEYLNGKRNRKGKEYWNHILIYEGEY